MLNARTLLLRDGIAVTNVVCRHARGRGVDGEQTSGHAIVFVRRGCFIRSANGVESVLDPTLVYCMSPGEEQRYDHPHDHGDECTAIFLQPSLLASLYGGEPTLPTRPLPTAPDIDLAHRALLARAVGGADVDELVERAITLTARMLEHGDEPRVVSGRPATMKARRALVDGVREALVDEPARSLPDLAATLAVSPHHLSRVFHAMTGSTIARHRMRLRTRAALERLNGGDDNLARIAADLGFADHGHLCRVLRDETGQAPSELRRTLSLGREPTRG